LNNLKNTQHRKDLARDIQHASNVMRTDDGTNGILDYIEQMSWMIFLKIFEDLEKRYAANFFLNNKKYTQKIPKKYSWSNWAKDDEIRKGDILKFIDIDLFPTLQKLKGDKQKNLIAEIFTEIKGNKMRSKANFLDVVDVIEQIDFQNPKDTHMLSQFYEEQLLKLGKEGGYAGELYTPRPVIKLMVKILSPQLKTNQKLNRIIDPFSGSCGFLIESFKHIQKNEKLSVDESTSLQSVFYGQEKKALPYLIGIMNCILHGLSEPTIIRKNTLNQNILNFEPDEKFDYVLTNPPFGGKENKQIVQNFPVKVTATELLSIQHILKRLNVGGKCALVLPTSVLSATDTSSISIKKDLIENFNISTIVDLPIGVFANVSAKSKGPRTSLLFFEKGSKTKEIWYYELEDNKYSKSNTVQDEDLIDCFKKFKKKDIGKNSWVLSYDEILQKNYNISAINPRLLVHKSSKSKKVLLSELNKHEIDFDKQFAEIVNNMRTLKKSHKILINFQKKILESKTIMIPSIPMSKFLKLRKDPIKITDTTKYKRVKVKIHGKGIQLRDEVFGSEIKTKKQFIVKPNDLIVAEIDAKVGGFGIIPSELDGAIVSNHYFLYEIDDSIMRPEFVQMYFQTNRVVDDLKSKGLIKGSHNYASIRDDSILQLEMPRPSLPEQVALISMQNSLSKILLANNSFADDLQSMNLKLYTNLLKIN
jgi:type I restriction enzyme M protein